MQPFLVPNCIAYKSSGKRKGVVCDIEKARVLEEKLQNEFNIELSGIIRDIEKDLRQKKVMMIDEKAKQHIRKGQVSYKVFDNENCMNCFLDTKKDNYQDTSKNPYNGDLNLGISAEKFQLVTKADNLLE